MKYEWQARFGDFAASHHLWVTNNELANCYYDVSRPKNNANPIYTFLVSFFIWMILIYKQINVTIEIKTHCDNSQPWIGRSALL